MHKIPKMGENDQVSASMEVLLHPLVLLNVSDHITRDRVRGGSGVCGILLGEMSGRTVHIHTSFEVLPGSVEGTMDQEHLEERCRLFEQIFPSYEVLGWYRRGSLPMGEGSEEDKAAHGQLLAINEHPFLLVFSEEQCSAHVFDPSGGCFDEASVRIVMSESERVSVEHIASAQCPGQGQSSLVPVFRSQADAIDMLRSRVLVLEQYLIKVETGEVAPDPALLRRIRAASDRLRAVASCVNQSGTEELVLVETETLLATITRGLTEANELVERYLDGKSSKEDVGVELSF